MLTKSPGRVSNDCGLKNREFNFTPNQPWCRTDNELTFFDEGRHLEAIYRRSEDSEENEESQTSHSAEWAQVSAPDKLSDAEPCHPGIQKSPETETGSPFSTRNQLAQFVRDSSIGTFVSHRASLSPSSHSKSSTQTTTTNTSFVRRNLQPLYSEMTLWPIEDPNEANLIQYFIKHMSPRFDLCDPQRHFALVVPCRAATCPPLMNAAFALSARYLSQTTNFDELISHRYYQKCLNSLVPMFGDPKALLDENLFAATVILRTLEEIEGVSSPISTIADLVNATPYNHCLSAKLSEK